jgi:hypothetical protein
VEFGIVVRMEVLNSDKFALPLILDSGNLEVEKGAHRTTYLYI